MSTSSSWFVICHLIMLLSISSCSAEDEKTPRYFSNEGLLSDWHTAGQFLGLDTSQGVASLVSSSFAPAAEKQGDPTSNSLFHGFFRLLGFDSSKLNAIAVNAVVFIAKMIGSSLIKNFTGSQTGRGLNEELPEGSPLSWILDDVKDQAQLLLRRAQDDGLPDQLIADLQSSPAHTDCIQLLVCRSAPFLHSMQRSLQDLLSTSTPDTASWATLSPLHRLYFYLPSRQQLVDSAEECGLRIPSCRQLFSAFEE